MFKRLKALRDAYRAQRMIEEGEWIICWDEDDGEEAEIIDFLAYLEDDTEGTP